MKPRVIIYNAISLDSRIDWFMPDVGLYYEQIQKFNEDATLAGCDTLLNPPDEIPEETEDDLKPIEVSPDDPRPILVVADSRGRLRNWHFWRKQPYWKDFIALCSRKTPDDYFEYLERRHVQYLVIGEDHVDFTEALDQLNSRYGVKVVRLESGGTLNGVLLRLGLVDEIHLLIHPVLVGGSSPKSFFRASDLESEKGVVPLKLKSIDKLKGGILLVTYEVRGYSNDG